MQLPGKEKKKKKEKQLRAMRSLRLKKSNQSQQREVAAVKRTINELKQSHSKPTAWVESDFCSLQFTHF